MIKSLNLGHIPIALTVGAVFSACFSGVYEFYYLFSLGLDPRAFPLSLADLSLMGVKNILPICALAYTVMAVFGVYGKTIERLIFRKKTYVDMNIGTLVAAGIFLAVTCLMFIIYVRKEMFYYYLVLFPAFCFGMCISFVKRLLDRRIVLGIVIILFVLMLDGLMGVSAAIFDLEKTSTAKKDRIEYAGKIHQVHIIKDYSSYILIYNDKFSLVPKSDVKYIEYGKRRFPIVSVLCYHWNISCPD